MLLVEALACRPAPRTMQMSYSPGIDEARKPLPVTWFQGRDFVLSALLFEGYGALRGALMEHLLASFIRRPPDAVSSTQRPECTPTHLV